MGAAEPGLDLVRPRPVRRGRAAARRVGHRVRRARRLGWHELGARPARVGPVHPGPARRGRACSPSGSCATRPSSGTAGPRRSCGCCSPTSRSGAASPAHALELATEARAVFQELGDAVGRAAVGRAGDARAERAACARPRPSRCVDDADEVAQRVPRPLDAPARDRCFASRSAVQVGDPEAYELARRMIDGLQQVDERFLTDEQHTLWGLAQLQHGDVDQARRDPARRAGHDAEPGPAGCRGRRARRRARRRPASRARRSRSAPRPKSSR